jgi:hypothetical protein
VKYPSLKSVNLIVLDGRSEDPHLPVYISGCLLALANRYDGHVLVFCSTKSQVDEVESLGEELGLDFFFHGDQASSSIEFLDYCESAQKVIEPNQKFDKNRELRCLREMNKRVIMPLSVASTVEIWSEVIVLKDEEVTPSRIMEIILS